MKIAVLLQFIGCSIFVLLFLFFPHGPAQSPVTLTLLIVGAVLIFLSIPIMIAHKNDEKHG